MFPQFDCVAVMYLLMWQSFMKCNVSGKYVSLFARGFSSFSAFYFLGHQTAGTLAIQSKRTAGKDKESEKVGKRRAGEQNTKAAGALLSREMPEITCIATMGGYG